MRIAIQPPYALASRSTVADVVVPGWVGAIAELDARNEYLMFNAAFGDPAARAAQTYCPDKPNFARSFARVPERLAEKTQLLGVDLLGSALRRRGVDLLHQIEPFGVSPLRFPTVQTLYDLIPELFPDWTPPDYEAMRRRRRANFLRAVHLTAISEHTKRDAVRYYGIAPEKIDVIHCGVDRRFYRPVEDRAELEELARRLSLPKRFVLSTGEYGIKKNHERLIEACAALGAGFEDVALVLVGHPSPYQEKLSRLAKEKRARVIFAGVLTRRELVGLYTLAAAFGFAGLYEGFGLPLVEAMACGCPVVASTVSVFPEIVGDAGLLVDPADPVAIAGALRAILGDPARAADLRAKGFARAGAFTWEAAARKTIALYERLGAAQSTASQRSGGAAGAR